MTACALCRGHGDEADEGEFRACHMCGGSGDAVPCSKDYWPQRTFIYCNRPSSTWNDETPVCHRHDPETMKKVREQVARAREKVKT